MEQTIEAPRVSRGPKQKNFPTGPIVTVEIPTLEITGGEHPDVQINKDKYEAGKSYKVTEARKKGIENILKNHAAACLRKTQGRKVENVGLSPSADKRV